MSMRTVTEWRRIGAPVHDLSQLRAWIEAKRREDGRTGGHKMRMPDVTAGDSEMSYSEARRVRAVADAGKAQLLLAKARGDLLTKESVQDGIAKGMATVFSELEREFCDKFPAVAKGLGAPEIPAGASATIERIKTRLREAWSGPGAFQQTEQKL